MSGAVHRPVRDVDWILAVAAAAVGAVAFTLVLRPASADQTGSERPQIAALETALSDVRRRPTGTLVWEELGPGAALREGDALFVPPSSAATVVFEDGTRLELDENTLVALEPRRKEDEARRVRVARGQVVGHSKDTALALETAEAVAVLERGSEARLESGADGQEVDVLRGSAQLGDGTRVGARESAVASAGAWKHKGRRPVELVAPAAMDRFYFSGAAPAAIELSWTGGPAQAARVEVTGGDAASPMVIAGASPVPFTPPGPGRYEWRVLDSAGQPLSLTRRFFVIHDLPPTIVSPRQGERVAGYLDEKVPFAWSRVAGVRTYEVAVADSEAFSNIVFRRTVDGTGLRVAWPAGEGRYYWRVRSLDEERGTSPWSRAASFQFLGKPVPDAPELMDTALELDP